MQVILRSDVAGLGQQCHLFADVLARLKERRVAVGDPNPPNFASIRPLLAEHGNGKNGC